MTNDRERAEHVAQEIWRISCDANDRYNALPNDEDASIEAGLIGKEACGKIADYILAAMNEARLEHLKFLRDNTTSQTSTWTLVREGIAELEAATAKR